MTNVELLTNVDRWVGIGIAVVGAVVVAPNGTSLLLKSVLSWLRRQGHQVRGRLARLLPFLRRDVNIQTVTASGAVSMGNVSTLTVSGRVWRPSDPVDERIEALRVHITEVETKLTQVSSQLQQESSARAKALADLEQALRAETTELRRLLDERDRTAAQIDARGLPVIAAGIVLSGAPDQLATLRYNTGWLLPALGVVLAVAAAVPAWREAHRDVTLTP